MRKCYLCGGEVGWKADYSFEDFGCEGNGIVHVYKCRKCGAMIEVSEEIDGTDIDTSYVNERNAMGQKG